MEQQVNSFEAGRGGGGLGLTVLAAMLIPWASFILSLVAGLSSPNYNLVESFAETVGSRFAELDPFSQTLFIFVSNMVTTILVYILTLALILPGALLIAFNGFVIGSTISYAVNVKGLTFMQVIGLLAPHGVVELPTFLGVASAGAYCLLRCRGFTRLMSFTIKVLTIAAALLMVAALIEVFVTPIVGRALGA